MAGRLTTITRPNGTQRIISYDPAGDETNILEETGVGFPIALFRMNWNNASEMQWEFAAPLPHTNAPPTRTMTYHDDNELWTVDNLPVTEDNDGNLTSGPLTNDTFAAYHFDARNRLHDVGGVTNIYDGMNNRIAQTCGTNSVSYVINPNAKLPQVLERIKNGVTTYYIYGAGLLYQVAETATSTNALYYHYDFRGSTVALTDDNGNVRDRFEYSLYATLTYRAGTDDTPFLFNGRYGVQTDKNGPLYMRARYYNPYLCRFLNPDPSGFAGGLDFYAYANGNPVSYLDPYGLSPNWGLVGKSTLGLVGNGVVVLAGYLAAPETLGATAVPATLAAYGVGANAGNIINGLFNQPAGPAGPVQTVATVIAPNNETANNIGQAGDLFANLVTGNELGSEEEIASAAGLVTAAQYDNATLGFANQLSTIYLGAMRADAGVTAYDAWSWALPSTGSVGSSTGK